MYVDLATAHSIESSRSPSTSIPNGTSISDHLLPEPGKRGRKRASNTEDDEMVDKRRRNNAAAAKYRQKKLDRIEELEMALSTMTKERDDLKVQLAKKDGEVELLNRLLKANA